jgi:NADH-quinone oxidoreductase subunit J
MTLYTLMFYLLGTITVICTAMAITRSNLLHAGLWLVASFFSTALIFYLLGAPFLAALEIIIYAGAIMILFIFIIMTLPDRPQPWARRSFWRQWRLPLGLGAISLALSGFFIFSAVGSDFLLRPAMAAPVDFGRLLVDEYWLPVEIVSFLLFVALVGVLYLGRVAGAEEAGEAGAPAPQKERP